MVRAWIIFRLDHPGIFWEEWPFVRAAVEKAETVQTRARLKHSYRAIEILTVINRGVRKPTGYEDQLKKETADGR